MTLNELIRYGVPPEIIQLWKERESARLLPVQELAVKRYGLFDEGNLLIQAPTSSGKTFVGEMAAVQTALRRKQVVYLVPLKALAEEKYRDFKEKYSDYGIRVIISSRDHREFDRDLEDGRFSIAVVVYEKLAQLLVRRPERIGEIELIIADELELISDADRGPMVELLLTRIRGSHCRLVGLSAVLGEAEKLAEWMRATLLSYDRRPVELRYGVLHEGTFRYRTYNEFSEGEEPLVDAHSESTWDQLTQNVAAFAEAGETCLVFVKAKHEARTGAELLSRRVECPPAEDAIRALKELEATCARDTLLHTLHTGVAFHSTDLSPEERRIVEQGFRSGAIRVLISTSTLAVGLNLPARNAFISAEKWHYDQRFGMPWKTPVLRSEFENMGGRAGRYGAGHAFGRAILIAATPFDQETLWRRYIDGEREAVEPRLANHPLENAVLQLVASQACRTHEELIAFFEETLSGQWIWQTFYSREEVEFRIRAAVNRAIDAGTVALADETRLEATPLGIAVASSGVTIATARDLEHWIRQSERRTWCDLDLLYAAASTTDGRLFNVALTAYEYDRANYTGILKRMTRDEDADADVPLNRIRNSSVAPFYEEVRAIKIALFLHDWIDHTPLSDIEVRFRTMTGQILAAADQISWILDAAAAIASAQGAHGPFVERIRILSQCVQRGLREEALPLARLREPGIPRSALAALVAQELHTPEALADVPDALLEHWLTPAQVQNVRAWAELQVSRRGAGRKSSASMPIPPILRIDDRHPGEITLAGQRVPLQERQYQLIRALAEAPGECVPYETIYRAVWGDLIVEEGQLHYQKSQLRRRIKKAAPDHVDLVSTVPKRGFRLNLKPLEVALHVAEEECSVA